jgi:hypothetical protein
MPPTPTTSTGQITGVSDCGTIIIVHVKADDGDHFIVPFDHSPFRWLLQGEGCSPADLIGRQVECDGQALYFLD